MFTISARQEHGMFLGFSLPLALALLSVYPFLVACGPLTQGDEKILLPGFEPGLFGPGVTPEPAAEATTAPVSSTSVTVSATTALAQRYLPIFVFDWDAVCFPGDLRSPHGPACLPFSRTAHVFANALQCGDEHVVVQYHLWYGRARACAGAADGAHVQVWANVTSGAVERVRFDTSGEGGFYFRGADKGAEMRGDRAVVYVGRDAHAMFHRSCASGRDAEGSAQCLGGCGEWDDFRRASEFYVLDQGKIVVNQLAREIDCGVGECKMGDSYWRRASNSSCYGVFM